MEDEVRKLLKRSIIWTVVTAFVVLVLQTVFLVFAISRFVDFNNKSFSELFFAFLAITASVVLGVMCVVEFVPQMKDYKFYKNNGVEKMRAIVVNIRSATYFGDHIYFYKTTVRNLETGEKVVFSLEKKDIEKERVYDFWYLKHSKIVKYILVSDEELTEESRKKASKISLDSSNRIDWEQNS